MTHPSYPQTAYRRVPILGFSQRTNRRRRRRIWPDLLLAFTFGLLIGLYIRGGGAWLP